MRKMTTALIWILLVLFVCFKIIGEVDAEVQVSILSPLNFTKLNAPTILQLWVWRNIFERSKRGWAQLTRLAIPPALVKSLYTGGHNVCTFWFTERMPAQNPLTSLLKPSPTRVTLFTLTKRKLLYSINRRTIQKSSSSTLGAGSFCPIKRSTKATPSLPYSLKTCFLHGIVTLPSPKNAINQ